MNNLLKLATEAHGGVNRWNRLKSLKADLSVTGGIWHVKGRPDVLKDIQIECPLHEERRQQVSYFGPDGLLRRHEYTVDILGGATGVNYAHDYRSVDGIAVPMKRRVYSYDADKRKVPDPVLVAIDIHSIAFSHS